MSIDTALVRPAAATETTAVSRLLTDAFLAGPLAEHLVGDVAQRQRITAAYWSMIVEHAQHSTTSAHIDVIGQADAAAIWYPTPAGQTPDLVPDDYDQRLADAAGPHLHRFRALDELMHTVIPQIDTGWAYLGFVGVWPSAQDRGLGSTLLQRYHRTLDNNHTPAFLVASSGRSRQLYLRLGYRDHGAPLHVTDGVLMYPMLRTPHAA